MIDGSSPSVFSTRTVHIAKQKVQYPIYLTSDSLLLLLLLFATLRHIRMHTHGAEYIRRTRKKRNIY